MQYVETDYVFTRYIFPLSEDLVLSKKLGISLSNPKTVEEIEQIKNLIEVSMRIEGLHENSNPKMRIPLESDYGGMVSVIGGLNKFKENYLEDNYVSSFLNKNAESSEWELLARMWVVVRFEYETTSIYENAKQHELDKLFYPEDERPIKENAINYGNFLSLLLSKGFSDCYGEAIVLPDLEFYLSHPEPNISINSAILYFCANNYGVVTRRDSFYSFHTMREKIIKSARLIEECLTIENAQKILYIGSLLKVCTAKNLDSRMRFINYVSILELMLTHNPSFNRFNVEDSISKQFKLKTAILVYQYDRSKNLAVIRNNLKEIYDQRSNIAHGNFNQFHKYLVGNTKKGSYSMEKFYELEDKLFEYNQIVIQSYLEDKTFVDFLKDN